MKSSQFFPALYRLLCLFELLQLLRYPIELGLLLGHLLLQLLLLFLSLLHLIANQSAADQTDGSANTGARSGMSGRAADDTAEARSGKCPNSGALLPGRQRLGTTEKKRP